MPQFSNFSNDNLNSYERTWSFLDNQKLNGDRTIQNGEQNFSQAVNSGKDKENSPQRGFKNSQSDYSLSLHRSPVSPTDDFATKRELEKFEEEMLSRNRRGAKSKNPANSPNTPGYVELQTTTNDKPDGKNSEKFSFENEFMATTSSKGDHSARRSFRVPQNLPTGRQPASMIVDTEVTPSWEMISTSQKEASVPSIGRKPRNDFSATKISMSEPRSARVAAQSEIENIVHDCDESPTELVSMTQSPRKPGSGWGGHFENRASSRKTEVPQLPKPAAANFQTKTKLDTKTANLIKDLRKIQDKLLLTNQKWFQIETLILALENSNYYDKYFKEELEKHAKEMCTRHEF